MDKNFFTVRHPEYGSVTVVAVDSPDAIIKAGIKWHTGWTEIAKDCIVSKQGLARKPRCKRCGQEFGEPGSPGDCCSDCAKMIDIATRRKYIRQPDRRAGMRRRQLWQD